MSTAVQEALDHLRSLASPAQAEDWALEGRAPDARPAVNAHIHLPPNFSAFESVEQAVELAAGQDIGVLGVSNYYDFEVYGDFAAEARCRGIFPLFGLEIIVMDDALRTAGVRLNDPGNPGKMYLCGKGITRFDELTAEAARIQGTIRASDAARMKTMIERMEAVFAKTGVATGLTEKAVIDRIVRRHDCPRETVWIQERHVAQAFQEIFFERVAEGERAAMLEKIFGVPAKAKPADAVGIQNEIRSHLMKAGKAAFVEESFVNLEEAKRLILELGGIPCYPTLADGASPICQYEESPEKLIDNIKGSGLYCAEFIPIRNKPEVLERYVRAMRGAGLVVTGGTEHNTLDLIPIEPACVGGAPVPEPIKEIFWEGACVVAAHQFAVLHGQCGFVDGQGRPNPAYKTAEERIAAFAALGAAVIGRFDEVNAG